MRMIMPMPMSYCPCPIAHVLLPMSYCPCPAKLPIAYLCGSMPIANRVEYVVKLAFGDVGLLHCGGHRPHVAVMNHPGFIGRYFWAKATSAIFSAHYCFCLANAPQ
jgi:hypothetical protein